MKLLRDSSHNKLNSLTKINAKTSSQSSQSITRRRFDLIDLQFSSSLNQVLVCSLIVDKSGRVVTKYSYVNPTKAASPRAAP
jgi:hypothetical protein